MTPPKIRLSFFLHHAGYASLKKGIHKKTLFLLGIGPLREEAALRIMFNIFTYYLYILLFIFITPKLRFRRIPPGLFPALYTSLAILSKFAVESIFKPSPKELAKQD